MPQHPAEARQRRTGMLAMLALGAVAVGLVVQYRIFRIVPTSIRTDGPFAATLRADGGVELGAATRAVAPGELFGWNSRFCLPPDVHLMMQVRLMAPDGAALLYRERDLAADAQGCSSTTWQITMPLSAVPGRYQVERFVLAGSPGASPKLHALPPLALDVRSP